MIEKFLTKEEVMDIQEILGELPKGSRLLNELRNILEKAENSQDRSSITRAQFATLQDNINHISRHLQEQTHPNKCLVVSTAAIYDTLIEVSTNG